MNDEHATPSVARETSADAGPAESVDVPVPPRLRRHRSQRLLLGGITASLLVLVLVFGGISALGVGSGDAERDDPVSGGLYFEIPYGASETIDQPGITSAIEIPTDIRFGPGDTAAITIVNYDTVQHRAGPFLVGAGQTFVQRFPSAGVYPINCTVDDSESIVVTVVT